MMKMLNRLLLLAPLILLLGVSRVAYAEPGNYASDADLKPIVKLITVGDFDGAIDKLHEELDYDPDNPDILSLLGFSYRATRRYDEALTFYQWALRSDPDHKGANEYLGELYLQTNQLDKAMHQLEVLDGLCTFNCPEYTKLKRAIDKYQQEMASNS